jgi:hypothetical protein
VFGGNVLSELKVRANQGAEPLKMADCGTDRESGCDAEDPLRWTRS